MLEPGGEADLAEEPLGPERGGQLGAQHLEGDLPVVLTVESEVDGRHAALAQLALDAVALVERLVQLAGGGHGLEGAGRLRRAPARRITYRSRRAPCALPPPPPSPAPPGPRTRRPPPARTGRPSADTRLPRPPGAS